MPSKSKVLKGKALAEFEAKRDLAAELLESIGQMKRSEVSVVLVPAAQAREKTGTVRQVARCFGPHPARVGARPQTAEWGCTYAFANCREKSQGIVGSRAAVNGLYNLRLNPTRESPQLRQLCEEILAQLSPASVCCARVN
jgi:hypothetical protein